MFRSKIWALLPLLVFIVLYLATSLVLNDFYKMPVIVAFLIAAVVAFVLYPRISFHEKTEHFTRSAGDPNIMLMILIFVLAGAFAGVSKSMGAVEATINFGLAHLSPRFLIAGLFLTACFISLSLGTSVGTIVALAPIAVGMSESVPGSLAVALGAVVGGAMFGDNLSMISDTTIAATRTQGVEMREKFKVNFWIALPPAVVTFAIYSFASPFNTVVPGEHTYSLVRIVPYLFVLVAALAGLNVIWVLIAGIVLAVGIGLWHSNASIWQLIESMNAGIASMFELSVLCLIIGGVVGLIRHYGGIDYILTHVARKVKGVRSGELGIAALTALVNASLANNTITILIVGPLAKRIADENGIEPRRSASILDTMSCFVQGFLPYGAQVLAATAIASQKITPLQLMANLYYPYLLGLSALVFIFIRRHRAIAS